MSRLFEGIKIYLKHVNAIIFVLIFYGLIVLISYSAIAIVNLYSGAGQFEGADLSKLSYLRKFIIVVFAIPIAETVFFQYLVIKLSQHFFKIRSVSIFLSAFCFGFSHLYSLTYFVTGIFVGLIFAICFTIAECRKESSIILVASVHALYNLSTLILNDA